MKREKMKAKLEEDNEDEKQKSVIFLSSSDDEEANGDLSLEILEKARQRENKRKRSQDSVITLCSSSSDEVEVVADRSNGGGGGERMASMELPMLKMRKKKKKKKKSKKEKKYNNIEAKEEEKEKILNFVDEEKVKTVESAGKETVGVVDTEVVVRAKPMEVEEAGVVGSDELVEKPKPMEAEGAELFDNVVLRKLLRGPRYFDPSDTNWSTTCYNCGEEGHMAVNCKLEKRKKPCFVCGSFEHGARQCTQGQDCFICKKTGHRAKQCPEKNKGNSQISEICLRCGDYGHNMFSCMNNYAAEDLKEIQCYICKRFGHLCCVDFMDSGPTEVSCYNCGQSGHTGSGCAKQRGDTSYEVSPTLCFKCGEEGHFARGCTTYSKPDWKRGEFSNPIQHFRREVRDPYGARSLPHDISKARKKKSISYEGRGTFTPKKSKHRGGWTTEDPGDLPYRKTESNIWRSPSTPSLKVHRNSAYAKKGHHSNSHSPLKKAKHIPRTPSSHGSAKPYYHHRYSASRFGNSSSGGARSHEW